MSSHKQKGSVNVERRTWDIEKYEDRAKLRTEAAVAANTVDKSNATNELKITNDKEEVEQEFRPAPSNRAGPAMSKRAFLQSRSSKFDLESKIGTTEVVVPPKAAPVTLENELDFDDETLPPICITDGMTKCGDGVGWHCRVCDCYLKDSMTYLDHVNGRKHQRALGYSMRIERVGVDSVKRKMEELVKLKESSQLASRKKEVSSFMKRDQGDGGDTATTNVFVEEVKRKDEEALKRKADRARRREERKKRRRAEQQAIVPIPKEVTNDGDVEGDDGGDTGIVEEDTGNDDFAAMMGFSGFGGAAAKKGKR